MKLWKNATFYQMTAEGDQVSAVLTENGQICAVGEAMDLEKQYVANITETIDLEGKVVFPGFVDAHIHLLWYGQALERLNLNQTTTKKEALALIAERTKQIASDEWLFVEGYDENKWSDEQTLISLADLDEVSQTNPILVRRIDYHSVSINSALQEKIADFSETGFDGGGEIVRDKTGEFIGVLRDNATTMAIDSFPAATPSELSAWLEIAITDLWSKGITGAHSEDLHYFTGFASTLAAFRNTIGSNKRPFRAHLLVHHAELAAFSASNESFVSGDAFLELGAMKIFYDGTVGSRTALMSAGYADNPSEKGLQIHSDQAFEDLVKAARKAGLPVAIHILGDQAFANVIRTLRANPPKEGQYDRLIHTPWLTEALIEEATGLPVLFDIQPQFMASDLPWALEVLGDNHPPLAFAWKTLLQAGFPLAGGSDAPIEVPNPFWGIHAAVTRTANADLDGVGYWPEQALTVFEAIQLYTKGAAFASYKTTTRGQIAPGFVADFTILAEDPFQMKQAELRQVSVVMTVVNEQIVYQKK
ncbi:amidohydrolase [Listeria monocytogenes]|nr:amidohydrolase [Listeria monocytogenes]EAD2109342.1 amidohydrolase [Listeria monocytogenes]EAG2510040.1 amidohydrolase [Listeria monocytogenes]EAW7087945.1 amidohydrolase [Listeria monocytogenes]EAW7214400.1 amidohydrolase [Listeria monocytogenes]